MSRIDTLLEHAGAWSAPDQFAVRDHIRMLHRHHHRASSSAEAIIAEMRGDGVSWPEIAQYLANEVARGRSA